MVTIIIRNFEGKQRLLDLPNVRTMKFKLIQDPLIDSTLTLRKTGKEYHSGF